MNFHQSIDDAPDFTHRGLQRHLPIGEPDPFALSPRPAA